MMNINNTNSSTVIEVTRVISQLGLKRVPLVADELQRKMTVRTYPELMLLVKTVVDIAVSDTRQCGASLFAVFCRAMSKRSDRLLGDLQVATRQATDGLWTCHVLGEPEVTNVTNCGDSERSALKHILVDYSFKTMLLRQCQMGLTDLDSSSNDPQVIVISSFIANLYITGLVPGSFAEAFLTSLFLACDGGNVTRIEAMGRFMAIAGQKMDLELRLRGVIEICIRGWDKLCAKTEVDVATRLRSRCQSAFLERKRGWKQVGKRVCGTTRHAAVPHPTAVTVVRRGKSISKSKPLFATGVIVSLNRGGGFIDGLRDGDLYQVKVAFARGKIYSRYLVGHKVRVKYVVTRHATFALGVTRNPSSPVRVPDGFHLNESGSWPELA